MGKSSSAKAEVVEYRMSLHVALGHEVDEIREIRVDERVAWSGRINTNTTLNIHQPNLFGGQTKEGGLSGFVQVLMGRPDQVLPAAAASRYRRSPADCPAFRGLTTLMFHGSGMVSTGRPGEWDGGLIGVAINNARYDSSGFLWKMNSTFIAQKIEVTATRAPKGIDNQTPGLNPDYALIGNDANPAHIIYEALVNRSWGMSGAPELIDKAVFEAEALRLFNEGFGLSFWWMRQQTIEDLITEILDHIQATIFVNPNNGLLSIRLLRDDYDIATLRHITPDNATLSNFKRRSSGEIVNEITVNFTNPLNEESESVTGQDIASIESQGGEKVAASRDYYMVRSRELATKILDRDLRASTAPLVSAEAKLDRSAWNILPGEVVLLSWPRRSMNAVVARVGKVSYGKPRDTAIRASLMQDVFSLTKPPVRVLPPTDWEDPTRDPQPLDMQLFTVPNYFVRNVELQDVPVELGAGEALVGSLADSETYDSFDYELVSESVTASGAAVITSKGAKSMTPKGVLATTLPAAANSTLPFALFPVAEETPVKGGFVFIGYGDDNQEIALVTGQSLAGWTIARGCLDTVPRSWAAGTPVWVVSPGASIVDTQTIHAEGSTARYRGLDRTARGLLGYDQAPSESVVVTARPHLPLRPANVTVNNVAFGSLAIGSASTVAVRWATRNRLTEDSQVLLWGDGPVQPEYRQETVIRVYDATTNALLKTYGGLWTETSASFSRSDLERYQSLRFEVLSRRNGEWSLTGHSVTVTGLAGEPSAPGLPDAIVEAGPPPSFYPAPRAGAFAAQAVALVGVAGAENPAIEISGTPDNLDMRGLATRYRRLPAPDPLTGVVPDIVFPWAFGPTAVLNGDDVRFLITGVAAETEYEVQVAYVVNDLPGMWRALGTVVTTRLIADLAPDARETIIQDIIEQVDIDVAEGLEAGRAALERSKEMGRALIDAAVAALEGTLSEEKVRHTEIQDALDRLGIAIVADPIARTGLVRKEVMAEGVGPSGKETFVQMNTRLTAVDAGLGLAVAQVEIDAKAYSDGLMAAAYLTLATKAELGSAIAASRLEIESWTNGQISTATANLITASGVDGKIASARLSIETWTNGQISTATANLATVAQMNAALAASDLTLKSYADDKVATATAGLATKAELASGLSTSELTLKNYTDGKVSNAVAGLISASEVDGKIATASLTLSSEIDSKVATATANLISAAQLSAALAGAELSLKSYTDNTVSDATALLASKAEVQTRGNMLPNSTAANGWNGWSRNANWQAMSGGSWGARFETGATGTHGNTSDQISVHASTAYVLSADLLRFATSGNVVVDVAWNNSSGGLIGYSPRIFASSSRDYGERLSVAITSPANAAFAQVRFFGESLSGVTRVGVRRIKLERGALPATAWTDDATDLQFSATAAIQADAIADAAAKLSQARLRLVTAAAGGNPAVVELFSDNAGASDIRLLARQIQMGENTILDTTTGLETSYFGTTRRVVAKGAAFGGSPDAGQLTEWEGPNSVAMNAMTRANAYYYRANTAPRHGGSALPGQGFHAQANAAVRIGSRTTAGSVTTAMVTITTTGATGLVSYAWSQIGGEETWTVTAPTGPETAFRVNVSSPGEQKRAQFACLVTDAGSGRVFTIPVGAAAIFNV